MNEEEEFEFRLRFEQETKEAPGGFWRGISDPFVSTIQSVYNMAPKYAQDIDDKAYNWLVDKGLPTEKGTIDQAIRKSETDYQKARKAGGEEGIDWDRIGGSIISTLAIPGSAMAKAKTFGGKMLAGTGAGAAYGSLNPVAEGDFLEEKAKQMGTGAAMGAAFPLAGAGVKFLDELTKPLYKKGIQRDVQKFLTEKAGSEKEKIIQALTKKKGTAGQTIAKNQVPGDDFGGQIVKLEKELSKTPVSGAKLRAKYGEQSDAREKIISAIAGTEDDMAKAVFKRTNVTSPLYSNVEKSTNIVDVNPVVSKIDDLLYKNPNESGIVKPLAEIKGKLDDQSPRALYSLSKEIKTMMNKTTPGGGKEYNVQVLDDVKNILDKQIGASEASFKVAQAQYKNLSKPINQMEVGKQLKDALVSASEQERPSVFLNAVKNAPNTLKRATGFKRYKSLSQVLTKDQMKGIEKISDDLITQAKANKMSQNMESIIKDLPGEITQPLPRILSRPVVLANHILSLVGKDKSSDYKEVLVDILENPDNLKKVLEGGGEKSTFIKGVLKELALIGGVKAVTGE